MLKINNIIGKSNAAGFCPKLFDGHLPEGFLFFLLVKNN
jgi:hypothetical protein